MQTADVVIVGGGIVGSSIAYHLTANGCGSVLVIERESAQGKGSTGKSMGGVRAQFSTPVSIQMSLYSIPFYASFEERLGYAFADELIPCASAQLAGQLIDVDDDPFSRNDKGLIVSRNIEGLPKCVRKRLVVC